MSKFRVRSNLIMSTNPEDEDQDFGVALDTRPKTKRPPLYKVMILNDDYTPMEESFDLMLTVHKKGLAVVGVFSHEIAETKVTQVIDMAQKHGHPLQCTLEKE